MRSRIVVWSVLILFALSCGSVFAGGKQETAGTKVPTIKLVWWSMWNETEPQAKVYKEAVKDYMAKHPQVKVSIQWNGREIRKTLQPALDAGTKIDIWEQDPEYAVKNWQSYALKLDSYFDKSYPTTGGKAYKDAVIPVLYNLIKTYSTDGALYAAPEQPYVVSVFYNKDLFKKAGVSLPPVGVKWSEFVTACAKLKAAGITPITFDDAYADLPLAIHLDRLYGDYKPVEKLVKDKTGKLWDDPRVLQTAKDYEMLASKGYFSSQVPTNKYPAGQQELATGQVAIYLQNGSWLPNEVRATAGTNFPWGEFAYPLVNNGKDNGSGGTFGSQSFQINKKCKNPDVAFDLIAFLTTGKWANKLAKDTMSIPMDLSAGWPKQLADDKAIFMSLKKIYPWSGGLAANPDLFPVIKKEFIDLVAGKINATEFVSAIKANIQK